MTTHPAPWESIDEGNLHASLLAAFAIDGEKPQLYYSYKPLVLLFDEYYTDLYGITEACYQRIKSCLLVPRSASILRKWH